jgi:hypothetical protein
LSDPVLPRVKSNSVPPAGHFPDSRTYPDASGRDYKSEKLCSGPSGRGRARVKSRADRPGGLGSSGKANRRRPGDVRSWGTCAANVKGRASAHAPMRPEWRRSRCPAWKRGCGANGCHFSGGDTGRSSLPAGLHSGRRRRSASMPVSRSTHAAHEPTGGLRHRCNPPYRPSGSALG